LLFYSLHQIDLNRSLSNTQVHQKCYRIYHDWWYSESVRNTKGTNVSSSLKHEIISINDQNNVPDKCCFSKASFSFLPSYDNIWVEKFTIFDILSTFSILIAKSPYHRSIFAKRNYKCWMKNSEMYEKTRLLGSKYLIHHWKLSVGCL
jgi:hypothetical protein